MEIEYVISLKEYHESVGFKTGVLSGLKVDNIFQVMVIIDFFYINAAKLINIIWWFAYLVRSKSIKHITSN